MLFGVAGLAVSPVIGSVSVVDICGFSGMLLVVGVEFLLRMKVSMSGWGGVSGLLSRIWLFNANGSIVVFGDDISLVFRRFSEGEV